MRGIKFQSIRTLIYFLITGLVVSCSNNSGSHKSSPTVRVSGIVLDSLDEPLADAAVLEQDANTTTQTGADGSFELQTGIGPKKLTITKNDVVIEQCLVLAEGVDYDLGTITPASPTHCDEVCLATPDSDDRDCDGIANDDELSGWDMTVTFGDDTTATRHVTTDPDLKDTDADGLSDGEEYAARTDPTRSDTDGDMLSDFAELNVYKSNPLLADTDGDSKGPGGDKPSDPNLWDGYEVQVSHTSPVLADTDGDGLTDYQEIHSGGTNPLVADLPVLALEVNGDPLLSLPHAIAAVGCNETTTSLEREAQEHVNTDNVTTKMSIENTIKLHTESEAGTSTWPPSFSAKLTTDTEFKHGYIHETTANFTQTSVQDNQEKTECWRQSNSDFSDGEISVAMKLKNLSSLSFKVKKIRVIAYQLTTGSNFRLIGSLDPDAADSDDNWNDEGTVLGPYGDITMTLKKTKIDAKTMEALVSDPSALMFEIGAYELFQLDDTGVTETVNYAKLGESVVQQTGLLTIDFGDGNIERRMIATNVNRNPDGSARGITLKEALSDILKVDYETETPKDSDGTIIGKKVLKKIKTTATYQDDNEQSGRGFWIIGGSDDAFDGIDTNFDDIVLTTGQRISLVFVRDTDLDAVFDNEEQLLGTDITVQDSDSDGLSDYDESKVGWDVVVNGAQYHTNPDPRFADFDGDYLADSAEEFIGTDPYLVNTDGDEVADTNDPYPLFATCKDGAELGLAAWWNGEMSSTTVLDQWYSPLVDSTGLGDPLGHASNGVLSGNLLQIAWNPDYITGAGTNAVFGFNTASLDQHNQQITVADDATLDLRRTLSPGAQLTVAAWVYWDGNATGAEWGTILTKGTPDTETYGLYVKANGALGFALYRKAHEKRWNWLGDSACEDHDPSLREWTETAADVLPRQTWSHVTITFGNEVMRIYVDGQEISAAAKTINPQVDQGACWSRSDTSYLIANNEPLRIALERESTSAVWPFRGMIDEVQVFGRQMTGTEVSLFHAIGICPSDI